MGPPKPLFNTCVLEHRGALDDSRGRWANAMGEDVVDPGRPVSSPHRWLQRNLGALAAELEQSGVRLGIAEAVDTRHVLEGATAAAHGVLPVSPGLVVLGTGVPVPERVGVTVVVTDGVNDGDGVVVVTVGVGFLVGFLVCVGDGVGLGVVVTAGITMTRGGGGGRTCR